MIKKPTLIVLVCAIVLGGAVYYFNSKQSKEKPAADAFTPAFSLQASDVTGLTIAHPAKPGQSAIHFEKHGDDWQITQPVDTGADQSSVQGLVDQIASARISQTEPGTADRLKAYDLDPAQISLEVQMRNGAKHTILMGDKDFTGSSVYAIVDGGKSVALLPDLLLTSADKPVDDLRDRAVLHLNSGQVKSFTIHRAGGDLQAMKEKDQWKFTKPVDALADSDAIQSLLSAVETGKISSVASEQATDLAKYGLNHPEITFTATNDVGKQSILIVGKKDKNTYFARDLSRPTIFSVSDDLHIKFSKSLLDLRDKKVIHLDASDAVRIEIHDPHGTIVAGEGDGSQWKVEEPAAQKGKMVTSSKIFDPVAALRVSEFVDHPAASVVAQLAKPAIQIDLTDKDGKKVTLRMSDPAGDSFYVQASDAPGLYKLKKQDFESVDIDPSKLAP
jgi:hypothetical protein